MRTRARAFSAHGRHSAPAAARVLAPAYVLQPERSCSSAGVRELNFAAQEVDRKLSMSAHAIAQNEADIFVVPDTLHDSRRAISRAVYICTCGHRNPTVQHELTCATPRSRSDSFSIRTSSTTLCASTQALLFASMDVPSALFASRTVSRES